jgi:hypothetical protein
MREREAPTQIDYVVVSLRPFQVLLNTSLQTVQIVNNRLVQIAAFRLLQSFGHTCNSVAQPGYLFAVLALLQSVASRSVLRSSSEVVVLSAHVMDPATADGLGAHGGLAT